MSNPLAIGDVVQPVEGGVRMKIEAIDAGDGRITCSWTSGPAVHRKRFAAGTLVRVTVPSLSGTVNPSAW